MVGHDRVVRDNVHRDIVLDDDISRLVDTRTFQRLRDVKQLATCHYVFPTATHTRFVHSLGAQHLAGVLWSIWKKSIQVESHPKMHVWFDMPHFCTTLATHRSATL